MKTQQSQRPGIAPNVRVVLSQAIDVAVRHGAMPANTLKATVRFRKPVSRPRPLTDVEIESMRRVLKTMRQKRSYLPDVFELMLATGLRLGEALALTYGQLEKASGDAPMTLTVTGTLIAPKGKPKRQPITKTEAGLRTLILPSSVEDFLIERIGFMTDPNELVFKNRDGGVIGTRTARERWQTLRKRSDVDLTWMTPHNLRDTLITRLIDDGVPIKDVAVQAGHLSVEVILKYYYPKKAAVAVDVRSSLNRFAPGAL
jgi:integrase